MLLKIQSISRLFLIACFFGGALLLNSGPLVSNAARAGSVQTQTSATLGGKITDSVSGETRPIDDATVSLYSKARILRTKSDRMGLFQFNDLPSGTYQLEVTRSGFKSKKVAVVQVNGNSNPLSIALDVATQGNCMTADSISYLDNNIGAFLSGVVAVGKEPLAHAHVEVVSLSGTRKLQTAETNDKGEFLFPKLEPGEYVLRTSHAGYHDDSTESFWIARENETKAVIRMVKQGLMRVCQ